MNDEKKNLWQITTGMLIHPRKTTAWLLQENHAGWIFPVAITVLMLVVFSVVQHNMINQQAQQTMPMIDPGALDSSTGGEMGGAAMMYGGGVVMMDESGLGGDMQDLPMNGAQAGESGITFILNTVGRVLSYLLIWLILSTSLHLGLMISGGNLQQRAVFHLAAWASLAIAVRCLIQILYMLIFRQPVLGDGLSGLFTEQNFFAYMMGSFDIYLLWQFALIFLGLRQTTKLSLGKLGGLAAFNFVFILLLAAIPPFVIDKIMAAISSSGGLL